MRDKSHVTSVYTVAYLLTHWRDLTQKLVSIAYCSRVKENVFY